ncbi:MAG TPA: hypothetical protein ENI43_02890 [Firmicutes bacterium]|nr:hypothetical protein [Bacillota bacterium]
MNDFDIVEVKAYLISGYDPDHYDSESLQVLCGGFGDIINGPDGPDEVVFAVPDDGIPVEVGFQGWKAYTEEDGSWGIDDGAEYEYHGLPETWHRGRHGDILWVALTQVKSDGIEDGDAPFSIGLSPVPEHCYWGINYNWEEDQPHLTCMIRLKIEYVADTVENSSLSVIKALYH